MIPPMRLPLSHAVSIASIAAASLSLAVLRAAPAAGPVEFVAHDIDPKLTGAYAVNTADFNHDGKVDVIANSIAAQELA